MIVLLSGARGIGKTTVCHELAALARQRGKMPGGIVSPARFDEEGWKTDVVCMHVETGEERLQGSSQRALTGPRVGRYAMDRRTLEWGTECILRAIERGRDPVFIDEIGPLELEQQEGLFATLPALQRHPGVNAVVVVRPELVGLLQGLLVSLGPRIYEVRRENRDRAAQELGDLLWGKRP